jgi:ectoine hydroxylase-related dioxygenase (phytanoyl-CoA dioxygenase family)
MFETPRQATEEAQVNDDPIVAQRSRRVWLTPESCKLDEFLRLIDRRANGADYPLAKTIRSDVPIYDGDAIRAAAGDAVRRKALMAEWAEAMLTGPGIVVFENAFADLGAVDAATRAFQEIIAEQRLNQTGGGDHFAKPGANDRVWNALEKLCLAAPDVFARYYANEAIAMVAQAWLGTGYQVTSQLNVVNPGGAAQSVHRDYHMGFQSAAEIEAFPAHAHQLSPVMTLQGAVAHCDMPIESGPTLYLPFSQNFLPGYFAWRRPEFIDHFERRHVQLPLAKGDAVFFNPALFHAAGHNRTSDVKRMANLLQISSAYGRAMESVDRVRMAKALYPALRGLNDLTERERANAIAAAAEGYAFPTNLDRDPPIGGLAPQTQAQLMAQALDENWPPAAFAQALDERARRRLT